MYTCVFVCLPTRLLITSDMIWTSNDWLNKFYSCYMVTVVGIVDGCGLGIDMCHGNQSNKSKLMLYKLLIHCNSH